MKRKSSEARPTGIPNPSASVSTPHVLRWSAATRIAFRFGFVYFGLFCLATQIAGSLLLFSNISFRGLGLVWPLRAITTWIAANIFNVDGPLSYGRNSGETIFFWIQTFWLLILAAVATAVWSVLDRRRENYATLHKWFRLFVRLALAASMFEYGMTKIIPIQFPRPPLNALVTPVGNLSLSNLLWTSIGASPAYEIFTGCAEMLGGILLLVPRTTMLGAMVCLAAMTHVFVLNMTYDIGLKQISFHLVLLAAFLLAPDFPRLANFLFRNRATGPSTEPPLFRSDRANRVALGVQILCGVYLVGMQTYANWNYWYMAGGGSPRSPLYGIWEVEQLSIDGRPRPPVHNDYDRRWRRVIFDAPDSMAFQRLDDSFARYGVSINEYEKTLALTKGNSRNWKAKLSFERPAVDRLTVDGEMDGQAIHMQLRLMDFDTFRVLNSGFRWIRPEEPQ
jgi:uncharacterized membrane protein YphA (DoxX/SURF4 family)